MRVADAMAKLEHSDAEVLQAVTDNLSKSIQDITPANAADIYCSYATLRAYEGTQHSVFMQKIMLKALQPERACFN